METEVADSYLCAVVMRLGNRRLLATRPGEAEETVQCAGPLQICRLNAAVSEPAGEADDLGGAVARRQKAQKLSKKGNSLDGRGEGDAGMAPCRSQKTGTQNHEHEPRRSGAPFVVRATAGDWVPELVGRRKDSRARGDAAWKREVARTGRRRRAAGSLTLVIGFGWCRGLRLPDVGPGDGALGVSQ